jgi:adenine-specific DNA-methyltransferase
VGAQIGIHNLRGEKVGTVSHTRNTEYLYVASDRPVAAAIADLAGRIHSRTVGASDA